MKSPRFVRPLAAAFAISVLASSFSWAQLSMEKVNATNKTLQFVKAAYNRLDARHQRMLDGYANIVHLADIWQRYAIHFTDPMFVARARMLPRGAALTPGSAGLVPVSNPSTDVAYSSFGGFTQSETSTARCGDSVVVGFNDSGSVFETPFFFSGTGGQSFSGYAYSSNGGASFTDGGPVNPGPGNGNFLGGDPGVNCSDAHTFYYSQIFDFFDSSGMPWAAVSINKSTDGGKTWGDPAPAIAKSGFTHFLDKPWSTIDPSHPSTIYVSYTDFDFSLNVCGTDSNGNAIPRTAIEFVVSTDGGNTWSSTPNIAIQVCGAAAVQGSQMAVSSTGVLYISWVNLGSNFPLGPRAMQISSFSGGVLSGPVNVNSFVQPGGDSFFLQGEFRDFLDMAMAVDHSGTASDGTLYISWADGRDKIVSDPLAIQGFYAYDDVFLSVSTNGGSTWSFPTKVNSDNQFSRLVPGRDHYQSGVAVDKRGVVALCWYDRRNDVENFAIRRHCGESSNGGATFSDVDIGLPSFAATHGIDLFINPVYMGDYDQMTSDFLNHNSGFIGSFQAMGARGNPDVWAHPMN